MMPEKTINPIACWPGRSCNDGGGRQGLWKIAFGWKLGSHVRVAFHQAADQADDDVADQTDQDTDDRVDQPVAGFVGFSCTTSGDEDDTGNNEAHDPQNGQDSQGIS